jgi:hypothetical protein
MALGSSSERANQALEQTRDSVLRYGESVGCELLNFFVRAWIPEPEPEPEPEQWWRAADGDRWDLRVSEKAVLAASIGLAMIQPRLAGLKPVDDRWWFRVESAFRPAKWVIP